MVKTGETWTSVGGRLEGGAEWGKSMELATSSEGAMGGAVTVVIACETRAIADALASLLSSDRRLVVQAKGGVDKLMEKSGLSPAVVITDDGDDQGTLQRLRRVKALWPGTRILVLGVPARPQRILDCIRAGANAFALRDLSGRKLVETIVQASRGEMRVPPSLLEGVFAAFSEVGHGAGYRRSGVDLLTPREAEVFDLLNRGFSNREIASKLNLGGQTVKNYVHNVMAKVQARRRSEIVFFDQSA